MDNGHQAQRRQTYLVAAFVAERVTTATAWHHKRMRRNLQQQVDACVRLCTLPKRVCRYVPQHLSSKQKGVPLEVPLHGEGGPQTGD